MSSRPQKSRLAAGAVSPTQASGLIQRKCACGQHRIAGGWCESCRDEQKGLAQRSGSGAAPASDHAARAVQGALLSSGRPLDAATRSYMEPRFQHDFSAVRVHAGPEAARSALALGASAYTLGEDVFFAQGRYRPETAEGRRLLAHELTHVVQQGGGAASPQTRLDVSGPGDASEREADAVAERVVSGGAAPAIGRHAGGVLRRQCDKATPKDCATYEAWLDTFTKAAAPAGAFAKNITEIPLLGLTVENLPPRADTDITANMPADLQGLITGQLSAGGGLPDCADVAFLLRHYYLKAKGQSSSFKVGRTDEDATTYTLGKSTSDKEVRACLIGSGTETFQETRSGFGVVNFYRKKGKNITNLKELVAAGLKPGDMFVWKRLPTVRGRFQGHAQTVQEVVPPQYDPADPKRLTVTGLLTVVQGNMEAGKGKGQLQQRLYTFTDLTGVPDGDAEIKNATEESFFGAGPWK